MTTFTKLAKTSIAATAALASIAPVVALADGKVFSDVDETSSHYEAIEALASKAIITGYPDGSFGVNDTLQRRHGAVLLYNALKLQAPTNLESILSTYNDVNKDSGYAEQIAAVTEAGIFKGTTGAFDADGDLTREQMATILVLALGLEDTGEDTGINLANVSDSHKQNVNILAQQGITNQLEDYRPHESVTRGQFATFLYLAQQKVVDSVAYADIEEDGYVPTGNAEFNIFASTEFFAANDTNMKYVDTTAFKVYDNKGLFNEDGTLAEAYEENGLSDDLIGTTVTVQVKSAVDEEIGKFDVAIVDGADIKAISGTVLLKGDSEVDFATMGSEFQVDVVEAINYNNEVIGDDASESIGLENLAGLDISSSDNSVFVVTNAGVLTPIKEGTANVVLKWEDKTFEFPVEVKEAPVVDSVSFTNGNTALMTTLFNQVAGGFVVLDQYGQEIANPGDLEIVPVDPADGVEGLTLTLNGNTIEVVASGLSDSVVASYAVQSANGDVLGEFTVDYTEVGETAEYYLMPTSEVSDFVIDYNSESDASINFAMIGIDINGYISEVTDLNNYTVELSGVTEGSEEATLVVAEDGTATLSATPFATETEQEVIVTIKDGNIYLTDGQFSVKNTTPAPAELQSIELANGVDAITISQDTTFDGISGDLVGLDQYGESYDLTTVAAELNTTVNGETIDLQDTATNGDTAQLTVKVNDIVKVFDIVVDKQ
ncbi:S-layer homology domain-containing protein [Aquibacillus salsiterrae]|uniref:S-layer homology domain-containing protein n=1 Tax=Aquibacillus salsiterrae TaxID=2950439 RepID=A0A9X3WIC2_9BACI|nr:S-layer homology domain-containing protein [Aquibacillus salsiterrae]MDC3417571.1 S-layer homology domain-containing protein [Aquibacillus salsiterrae]